MADNVNTVSFLIDLGESIEGDLPEDMELQQNKVQLSFGVLDKDMKVFTDVLRQNGIPHYVKPAGAISMKPSEMEIVYREDGDGYDEDELTD